MSRRATLSAQLAQLQGPTFDPDASDNLDGLRRSDEEEEEGKRDHYLAVGPSRLKGQMGAMAGDAGGRYGGEVRGRQKIFDDDDDKEEEEGGESEEEGDDDDEGEGSEMDDEDEEGDEEEDDDDEGEGDDDEDEDDGGEDGEDDESAEENEDEPKPAASTSTRTLDPVAALRDSRQKDVLKGQAIRRQQSLFESLLTIRITYQKALTSLSKLPLQLPADASEEAITARSDVLASLADLNEGMFELRQGITLPGQDIPEGLGKRKRAEADVEGMNYWIQAAEDSLALNDGMKEQMLPILNKWSTKIQAATLSIGGKAAGSSKFLQGTKGQMGVVEAIEAGLGNRRNPGPQSLLTLEETHYRSLLREIIDSRTTGQTHMPDTSYRLEKKKKRDAERGASKGRKIRYTVHDKAANFAVPMEIQQGWGEGQVDELFSSLLGGAGMGGARSEGGGGGSEGLGVGPRGDGGGEGGLSGLGGLRVF